MMEKRFMIFRTIRCSNCACEGLREIAGTVPAKPEADVFVDQGHDPYTGTLHFLCPRCRVPVAVDPGDALSTDRLTGYPIPPKTRPAGLTGRLSLMPVMGGIYAGFALFILAAKIFC